MIQLGDCLGIMLTIDGASVDAIVTDPPYGIEFMGKGWDHGVPGVPFWSAALDVAKPGAHLVAFGGTRTFHRLTCAIEDAGWEIRDCLCWLYGSGFPKSHDVAKALDRSAGVERADKFEGAFDRRAGPTGNRRCEQCGKWLVSGSPCQCPRPQDEAVSAEAQEWDGWGTALKPGWEPIILARKPLIGTVAENVQGFGTGALNVDECRIAGTKNVYGEYGRHVGTFYGDRGGASRFFYCAKASRAEREAGLDGLPIVHATCRPDSDDTDGRTIQERLHGRLARNHHPTVKPVALMRWLARLVVPPGGLVLDPFAGSGTTGIACELERLRFHGIEKEPEYLEIAMARLAAAAAPELFVADGEPDPRQEDLFGG